MANKKTKSELKQDDKVHVDFTDECAIFIRRFAFETKKSNNDAAHALMRMIISAEETTAVTMKPTEFPTEHGKPPIKFKTKVIKQIRIPV